MHSVDPFFVCFVCSRCFCVVLLCIIIHIVVFVFPPSLWSSFVSLSLVVLSNGIFLESNIGFFCSLYHLKIVCLQVITRFRLRWVALLQVSTNFTLKSLRWPWYEPSKLDVKRSDPGEWPIRACSLLWNLFWNFCLRIFLCLRLQLTALPPSYHRTTQTDCLLAKIPRYDFSFWQVAGKRELLSEVRRPLTIERLSCLEKWSRQWGQGRWLIYMEGMARRLFFFPFLFSCNNLIGPWPRSPAHA